MRYAHSAFPKFFERSRLLMEGRAGLIANATRAGERIMQDRYAGDIGDYIKLALLRALTPDLALGVAWYLYPDESHNEDGRHIGYLSNSEKWRHLDPALFDGLRTISSAGRSVAALERANLLSCRYANEVMDHATLHHSDRSLQRQHWFDRVMAELKGCDVVFADPDNGLMDANPKRRSSKRFGKQLPLDEAHRLADGRTAIIYHHNSRFTGGHDLEVDHWRELLGADTIAVRANAYSCRTFFIVNPTSAIAERAADFCNKWSRHRVALHQAAC